MATHHDSSLSYMVHHEIMSSSKPSRYHDSIKVFDEISERMFQDDDLYNAVEMWRVRPQILYVEIQRMGYERVKTRVREVKRLSGIRNRGAFLMNGLRKMK